MSWWKFSTYFFFFINMNEKYVPFNKNNTNLEQFLFSLFFGSFLPNDTLLMIKKLNCKILSFLTFSLTFPSIVRFLFLFLLPNNGWQRWRFMCDHDEIENRTIDSIEISHCSIQNVYHHYYVTKNKMIAIRQMKDVTQTELIQRKIYSTKQFELKEIIAMKFSSSFDRLKITIWPLIEHCHWYE